VGRKQLTTYTSITEEGKKRKKKIYRESDWEKYTSSCKELKQFIRKEGVDSFVFRILAWTKSRSMTSYLEAKYIWKYDALSRQLLPNGERMFWNANVAAVRFIEPKE
jgi:hypothetical protein